MELSYDRFRGLSTQGEGETDGQFLARRAELVLRKHKVEVDEYIFEQLAEIAAAELDEATILVMDLMGNAGLEPDDAFDEVMALAPEVLQAGTPGVGKQVATRCAELIQARGKEPPADRIARIKGRSAPELAADLLVDLGLYDSTQAALAALDPDGALRKAAAEQ
jgi:hypothetical protein